MASFGTGDEEVVRDGRREGGQLCETHGEGTTYHIRVCKIVTGRCLTEACSDVGGKEHHSVGNRCYDRRLQH